jgi:DNA excision repair protein ERCC-1
MLTKVLTCVKPVNKTDVVTLLDSFSTFANISKATEAEMLMCPGLGERKVRKLHQAFHEPFTASFDAVVTKKRSSEEEKS